MTQKTTLPLTFTGADAALLPKFMHSAPVSSNLVRRFAVASLDAAVGSRVTALPDLMEQGAPLVPTDASLAPVMRQYGEFRYLELSAGPLVSGAAPGSPVTAAVVARVNGRPQTGGYWSVVSFAPRLGQTLSIGVSGAVVSTSPGGAVSANMFPEESWQVFIVTFAGASSVINMSGKEFFHDIGTTQGQELSVGGISQPAAGPAQLDVAELLVWDRALTSAERTKVVKELTAAYQL